MLDARDVEDSDLATGLRDGKSAGVNSFLGSVLGSVLDHLDVLVAKVELEAVYFRPGAGSAGAYLEVVGGR